MEKLKTDILAISNFVTVVTQLHKSVKYEFSQTRLYYNAEIQFNILRDGR